MRGLPGEHALKPFLKGAVLPYRQDGVLVTAVTPKLEHGESRSMSGVHIIEAMAGAWAANGLVLGARWLCGGSSINAHIISEEIYRGVFAAYDFDDFMCVKCRTIRDGEAGPNPCVYRIWDRKRTRLLYIGSTKDWQSRIKGHRGATWWWDLAHHFDFEWFDTIEEARTAERDAIKAEHPHFNRQHNGKAASA